MMKLKLAYFGSPDFSAYFLEKLITDSQLKRIISVRMVVTQPDKPVGRKQILTPSPVKEKANKYHLECLEIRDWSRISGLKSAMRGLDLAFLYAYRKKIPSRLLVRPKYGFWNLHPSLLPKYRGPSPVAYPLILGEKKTGVTIIKMDNKIDHGPIISQQQLTILPKEKRDRLTIRLTDLGFELFKRSILSKPIAALTNQAKKQSDGQATYTRLLKKDDGFIPLFIIKKALCHQPLTAQELPILIKDYFKKNSTRLRNWQLEIRNSPKIIFNYFRGLFPWPGIWTMVTVKGENKRLKLTDVDLINNCLIIKKVHLEGKKEVDFPTFNQVYRIF